MQKQFQCLTILSTVILLSGCDQLDSIFGKRIECNDVTAIQTAKELFHDNISENTKQILLKDNLSFDPNYIKNSIAKVSIALEDTITEKKDKDSKKNFCSATLHINLDPKMIDDANFVNEMLATDVVSTSAYKKDIDMKENVIKYNLEYSVQPTDDGKKVQVILQNSKSLQQFISEIIANASQKTAIEQHQQNTQRTPTPVRDVPLINEDNSFGGGVPEQIPMDDNTAEGESFGGGA